MPTTRAETRKNAEYLAKCKLAKKRSSDAERKAKSRLQQQTTEAVSEQSQLNNKRVKLHRAASKRVKAAAKMTENESQQREKKRIGMQDHRMHDLGDDM